MKSARIRKNNYEMKRKDCLQERTILIIIHTRKTNINPKDNIYNLGKTYKAISYILQNVYNLKQLTDSNV